MICFNDTDTDTDVRSWLVDQMGRRSLDFTFSSLLENQLKYLGASDEDKDLIHSKELSFVITKLIMFRSNMFKVTFLKYYIPILS